MLKQITVFIFTLSIIGLLFLNPALADWRQNLNLIGDEAFNEGAGPPATSVTEIIGKIVRTILSFLGILFIILVMYAGHMWMFAGGNEDRVGKARKILINSAIGVALVLLSYAIAYFVFDALDAVS